MPLGPITLVADRSDAEQALDFLMDSVLIANDIETNPDLALITVNGFTGLHNDGKKHTFVFPYYAGKSHMLGTPTHLEYYLRVQQRVNASGIPFTFQNGAYDLFYLTRYAMPVKNYAYDSMTMWWSLFPELPKRLDFICSILLDDYVYWKGDRKSDDHLTYMMYNGRDCDRTLDVTLRLMDLITTDPRVLRNFADAHLRVCAALGMSMRGMRSDESRLAEHGVALEADAAKALARLRHLVANPEFNPNSPKQKSHLLYGMLGVRMRNAKGRFVSKVEDSTTGAVALRAMRSEHPLFRRVADGILQAMEPAKQISNVIGIRRADWGNGNTRLYTAYNGVGTTTSRLSSSETPIKVGTNLQNIRKTYRDWITAEPGCFLLEIDLSAGDDVFVSFESGDPRKIELFRSGKDSHAQNATLFFPSWTYEGIVRDKSSKDPEVKARITHPITGIRQITKKLSHGCNYIMAELTMLMTAGREAIVAAAKEVGFEDAGLWTQERLAEFCATREALYRNYYTRFQRAGEGSWYVDLQLEHKKTGGFMTPFSYFQRFLGDNADPNILRGLAATAGQAGTAGRINMAMAELIFGHMPAAFRDAPNPHYGRQARVISRAKNGISLRLQTHDSLTFNCDPRHKNIAEGIRGIFEVMSRPVVILNSQTGELEEFVVGIESEVGVAWGNGLTALKANTWETVQLALQ